MLSCLAWINYNTFYWSSKQRFYWTVTLLEVQNVTCILYSKHLIQWHSWKICHCLGSKGLDTFFGLAPDNKMMKNNNKQNPQHFQFLDVASVKSWASLLCFLTVCKCQKWFLDYILYSQCKNMQVLILFWEILNKEGKAHGQKVEWWWKNHSH